MVVNTEAERVITEFSWMTRSIEGEEFSIAGLGGLCPPSQNSGGLGGSAPQPKMFIHPFRNYRTTPRSLRATARLGRLRGALARSKGPRSRRLKIFRRPRGHFERVFARELAVFALELAPLSAPGTPRTSILEL